MNSNPKISIIAAMSKNRAIGLDGGLPWKLAIPADWENLHRVTRGKKMIMGRKTYQDEHKVTNDAGNIVITSNPNFKVEAGYEIAKNLTEALEKCKNQQEIFVIGGEKIFEEALPMAHKLVLTMVNADFEGDTFFPKFDENDFIITQKKDFNIGEGTPFPMTIITYERKENVD